MPPLAGQRAILSYYYSLSLADQAVQELKEAGFQTIQMDKIPRSSIAPNGYGLTGLSSLSWLAPKMMVGLDASIGNLASPEADGLFAADPVADHDYMVTVVADSQSIDHALSIVKKYAYIVN